MKNAKKKRDYCLGGGKPFKSFAFISLLALLAAFAYAVVRYHVIKGVPWENFPLFISNKAIALAAVVFIALSYDFGPLARFWPRVFVRELSTRKYFGLAGFGLAAAHAIISLILFSPAYYPKFFSAAGKLSLAGELSMMFGVLAFFVFLAVALTSIPSVGAAFDEKRWKAIQRAGYAAFALVMLHVLVMGVEGWLKPSGWPGGMLPISLVAFIIILLTLLARVAVSLLPRRGM